MSVFDRLNEGLQAVKAEVDRALLSGPVITPQEGFELGTLLRLTGRALLDAQPELERAVPPARTEREGRDLFRS